MSIQESIEKMKTDPLEYKRQTGRTTRMMHMAKAAAMSGKAVTVLMRHETDAKHWIERGWAIPGMEITWLKNAYELCINWETFRFTDHRANNALFIDHDVFEHRLRRLLELWTKFDRPMDQSPYIARQQAAT